jgi:hypothetical protein
MEKRDLEMEFRVIYILSMIFKYQVDSSFNRDIIPQW